MTNKKDYTLGNFKLNYEELEGSKKFNYKITITKYERVLDTITRWVKNHVQTRI